MKKIFSFIFIIVFTFILTGCGKTEVLTCTNGDRTIEYTFKGNKTVKVKTTYTADTEEDAKSYANLFNLYNSDDITVKADGKRVTITMTGAELEKETGQRNTKLEVRGYLEDNGYTCK